MNNFDDKPEMEDSNYLMISRIMEGYINLYSPGQVLSCFVEGLHSLAKQAKDKLNTPSMDVNSKEYRDLLLTHKLYHTLGNNLGDYLNTSFDIDDDERSRIETLVNQEIANLVKSKQNQQIVID